MDFFQVFINFAKTQTDLLDDLELESAKKKSKYNHFVKVFRAVV